VAKTTVSPSSLAPILKQIAVLNQLRQPIARGIPVLGVVALLATNVDTGRVTAILTMNAGLDSCAAKITAKTFIVEPTALPTAAFQGQVLEY